MKIPLKEIRRQIGRIERAAEELKKIQRSIPLPSPEELEAMTTGSRPFSEEAYALAVLQSAKLRLEEGTLDVRSDLTKENLRNPGLQCGRVNLDLVALVEAVRQEREHETTEMR